MRRREMATGHIPLIDLVFQVTHTSALELPPLGEGHILVYSR